MGIPLDLVLPPGTTPLYTALDLVMANARRLEVRADAAARRALLGHELLVGVALP